MIALVGAVSTIGAQSGCGRHDADVSKNAGADPLVTPGDQDLMDRAMARARETWEQLAVALSEAEPGWGGFAIKKGFPYADGDSVEYVWLRVVEWDGHVFRGIVDNTPAHTKRVAYGDEVEVRPEELADWMYLDGKELRGGFTLRVLYWQESGGAVRTAMDAKGIVVGPIDF